MHTNEFIFLCSGALIKAGAPLSGKELIYRLHLSSHDVGYCFHNLDKLSSLPFIETVRTDSGTVKYKWNPEYKTAGIKYGAGPAKTGDRHDWYCYTLGGKFYVQIPRGVYPLHGDTGVIRVTDPMRQTADLVCILRRTTERIDCVVELSNGRMFGKPMLTERFANSITVPPSIHARRGDRVSVSLCEWDTSDRPVCESIVNYGSAFNEDFKSAILRKYGIGTVTSLPTNVADRISSAASERFADMSKLPWISVYRKDIAYSVQKEEYGYKVAVCIANLPNYMPIGSPGEREFRRLGMSCVLRDGSIPVIDLSRCPALDLTSEGKHIGVYISLTLDIHGKPVGVDGVECIIGQSDFIAASDLTGYLWRQEWAFEEAHSKTMRCIMDFVEVCNLLGMSKCYDADFGSIYLAPYSDILWATDKAVTLALKGADFPFIGSKSVIPDDFDISRKDRAKSDMLNTVMYETVTKYLSVRPARPMHGYCVRVAEACTKYADYINLGLFVRYLRRTLQSDDAEEAWTPVSCQIAKEMECIDRRVRSAEREYALRYDTAASRTADRPASVMYKRDADDADG